MTVSRHTIDDGTYHEFRCLCYWIHDMQPVTISAEPRNPRDQEATGQPTENTDTQRCGTQQKCKECIDKGNR